MARQHGAAGDVQQQQLRARQRPQLSAGVQRHVQHRAVQLEQRRDAAAALGAETEDLVALRAGAGQHAAVGQLRHGQCADVAGTAGKAARKAAQLHRRQHAAQLGRLAGHQEAGQLLQRQVEHRVVGVAAAGLCDRQLGRGRHSLIAAQVALGLCTAAVVGQHGARDVGGLTVAGLVGGHGDELVGLAGLACEQAGALGLGELALPDAEVASVLGHVQRDVAHAAGVVAGVPLELVSRPALRVGAGASRLQRGAGSGCVELVQDAGAVDGRRGVEEGARLHLQRRASGGALRRAHGVARAAGAPLAVGRRQQQAARGVAQHFAGVGVDGLDQPGGDAARGVDAGADAQHEALAAGEVEVALEGRQARRHVHVDVADLEVTQAQAGRVEIRVELRHQAQLAHCGAAGVGEADGVGQRVVGRHVTLAAGREHRLRAAHGDVARGRAAAVAQFLQVLREAQRRRAHGLELNVQQPDVAQVLELGAAAGEDVETDEVRLRARATVEDGAVGRHGHRHTHLAEIPDIADFLVVHRRAARTDIARPAGGVAVPLLHLGEEAQQVGLRAKAVAGTADEHAAGQRGVQAQHEFVGADGRRLVSRSQQACGLQRRQPALHPLRLVRRQRRQGGGGAGIGKDGRSQPLGVLALVGDELIARQRRGRAQRVEAERHRHQFPRSEVDLWDCREEFRRQPALDVVQVLHPAIEQAGGLPVRALRVELVAQAFEVVVLPLGQAGVSLDVEGQAREAVAGDVKGIARGEVPARGVDGAVQRGPGHVAAQRLRGRGAVALGGAVAVLHGAGRAAAHVAAEHHVGQVQAFQHVGAAAHLGGADVEAHVGRVDVGQALQADAVDGTVAGLDVARAANADGDIRLDHALDQVAVRLGDALPVGVDHRQVVQAVRRMAQVEHGADARGVQHLPARRLDLELPRAGKLDERAGGEARALDVDRDPAVVVVAGPALVRADPRDRQRQRVGAQRGRGGRAGRGLARSHQHVVGTGLGAGYEQLLVWRQRVGVRGIEGGAGGHVAVADVQLVGAAGGAGVQRHAQRLARAHDDAVQPLGARAELQRLRRAQRQLAHLHVERGGAGGTVVGLAGGQVQPRVGVGDWALEDLVVEVGPHQHAPRALLERRQLGAQRAAVGAIGRQVTDAGYTAEQDVVQPPGAVGRQVQRVGPAADRGVARLVADGEGDLHLVADARFGRQGHRLHHQVRRRRRLDEHGRQRCRVVVGLRAELHHPAAVARPAGTRRIGDDEHVVRALEVARGDEAQGGLVAPDRAQAAGVLDVAQVAVLGGVQEPVARQVHHVVPAALVGRRVAAEIAHLEVHLERLSGHHARRRRDLRHAEVRRRHQADGQRDVAHVVALVAELQHRVGHPPQLADGAQTVADGARGPLAFDVVEDVGVGLDDEAEVTADRTGQREGGRVGVRLARLQEARAARGVGEAGKARGQLLLQALATVHQRVVASVQRRVAREVNAVEPAGHPRGARALVGDVPGGGDGLAGARVGVGNGDRIDHQVGLAVGDVQRAATDVVVVAQAFESTGGVEPVACGVVAAPRPAQGAFVLGVRPGRLKAGAHCIGDDVDVVRPVGACGQLDAGAGGVAGTSGQRREVGALHRGQEHRARRDQLRVGAEVDVVDPTARAGPHRAAVVGDGPGDRGLLAREVLGLGHHAADPQVGGLVRHRRGGGPGVVGLVDLAHVAGCSAAREGAVGLDDQEAARDRGRQRHGLAGAVALALAQTALLAVLAQQPAHGGLAQVGVVGDPDAVGPGAGEGVAVVAHRVAEAVVRGRRTCGRRDHLAHHEVGRGAEHRDRTRLVVVVVDLRGVVGVEVGRQRVLEDGVVGVAPDGDEVLTRPQALGNLHVQRAQVVLAHSQVARVRDLRQADVALGRRGARAVHRQPDAVGPAVDGGGIAAGLGRAAVADLVAHLDAAAGHGLPGRDDVAGHQVGKRHRVDLQPLGAGVVGLARVLVDAVGGIGHDDEVGAAAVADRDVHQRGGVGVALAGGQRGDAVESADEHVVGADRAVQREVDVVAPLPAGGQRAGVAHRELHRRPGACGHVRGHGGGGHAQVRPRRQRHRHGPVVVGAVVGARRTVLVHLRGRARAQQAVGHHPQPVAALDARGQAQLLAARVALACVEPAVVGEAAQQHRRTAVRRDQQHVVAPGAASRRGALVEHRPAQLDQRALLCRGRGLDRLDHQVGRRRQHHRHRRGAAGVVGGVDELERATRVHLHVPGALQALRQRGLDGARVAGPHAELPDLPGPGQLVARAAAVGVGRQPDPVFPGAAVGDADAAVGHRPAQLHRLPADRRGRPRHALHAQVRVRDGHHVEQAQGRRLVVALGSVLPHRAQRIGAHEHLALPGEARPEAVGDGPFVALAGPQRAVALHRAQHDVVAIAQHVVGGVHHAVGPAHAAARPHAHVGDHPAHRHAGRVGHHRLGGDGHAGDGEVGEEIARHVDCQPGRVVGLARRALGVGTRRVSHHDQPPRALQVGRQREGQFARRLGARGQTGDAAFAQQQVTGAHGIVGRQVHALQHAARLGVAWVARAPAQHERLAAAQRARGLQALQLQVGRSHRQRARGPVVGLVGLADPARSVGRHLQPPLARRQHRHGHRDRLRQRGAGGDRAERLVVAQQLSRVHPGDIHEPQFLAEQGVGGGIAAVAQQVAHRHAFAHAPGVRGCQRLHAQLGARRFQRHRARRGTVVDAGVGLQQLLRRIGHHREIEAAVQLQRQQYLGQDIVAVADGQRLGARQRSQQDVVGITEDVVAAEQQAVDPAACGRQLAVVAHRPGQVDGRAAAAGERRVEGRHHQVGIGPRLGHGLDHRAVVALGTHASGVVLDQRALAAAVLVGPDLETDAAGAAQAFGQLQAGAARQRGADGQRRIAGQRRVVGQHAVEQRLAGVGIDHPHPVVPAGRRGRQARIDIVPAQRQRAAGSEAARLDAQVLHAQVGRREQRRQAGVVGLGGVSGVALEDAAVDVGADAEFQPPGTGHTGRPGERQAAPAELAAGDGTVRYRVVGQRRVQQRHASVDIAHHHPVGKGGVGRRIAAVQHAPAQRHGVARDPAAGRLDGHAVDLQVGVRRQLGQRIGGARVVQFVGTGLDHGVGDIGGQLEAQVAGATGAAGQRDQHLAHTAFAGQQRGEGSLAAFDQHVADQLAAAVQVAHQQAVHPFCVGRLVAGITDLPAHQHLAAGLQLAAHRLDGQRLRHEVRRGPRHQVDDHRRLQRRGRDVELVAGRAAGVVAALDQQRVGALVGQRGDVLVAAEPVGPPQRAAPGVEQPPVGLAAVLRTPVEEEAFASMCVEAVGIGLAGRIEHAAGRRAGGELRGVRQVQQPEAVAAGDVGTGGGVLRVAHRQRVAARDQQQDRAAVGGIGGAPGLVVGFHPARARQAPAQVVVVDAGAGAQRIEVHQLGLVQREAVDVALAGLRDRLALRHVQLQLQRLVLHRLHAKGIAAGIAPVVARLDQHGVAAGIGQHGGAEVAAGAVEVALREQRPAEGIEHRPARIAAAARDHVEEHPLAAGSVEAVDIGLVGRVEAAADQAAQRHHRPGVQVQQAEAVAAGQLGRGGDAERVVASRQVHDRHAIGRVALPEGPVGDDGAARAAERPAQVVAVAAGHVGRQAVEDRTGGLVQAEAVDVGLAARHGGADRLAQRDVGGRRVLHAAHHEAVAAAVAAVVAGFHQQRVAAALRQRQRDVAGRVVEVRRAEHRAAVRRQQPPERVAAAALGDVEVQLVAGRAVEAVGIGLVGRVELAGHGLVDRERGGGAQVEPAEAVGAGNVVGRAHLEGVGAGRQVEDARAVGGIAVAEGLVLHHRPAVGPVQRPAQPVAVAAVDVDRQVVEVQPPRLVQRQRELVALAGRAQRGLPHLAQRDRRQRRGRARRHHDGDVVQVVVRAPAAVARAEGGAALGQAQPGDEVVVHDHDLGAALGPQVDRDVAAAVDRGHDDARALPGARVEAQAGHVELGQPGAVEMQRHMVVIALAVVRRVEADAEAARQVRFLAEQRRRAAVAPGQRVQPGEADAVALVADLGDAQVEAHLHLRRLHARRGVDEAHRVDAGDAARQQAQHVAAIAAVDHRRRRIAEAGRGIGQAVVVEVLCGAAGRIGLRGALHGEAVVHGRAFGHPAFQQQHVAAAERDGEQAVVGGGRAGHHAAVGPDQPPIGRVAAFADQIQPQLLAGGGVEGEEVGAAARVQRAGHLAVERDDRHVGGGGQVDQPEAVGAGRIAVRVYGERVVAGGQPQQRAAAQIGGVALGKVARADDVARGPAQPPLEAAAVEPRVEDQRARLAQAEAVAVDRAGRGNAAGHRRAQRQRRAVHHHRPHDERVAAVAPGIAPPLDQQRVAPGGRERADRHVVAGHVVRAEDGGAEGVDQPPERIAAAGPAHAELEALAGHRVEGPQLGLGAGGQLASDRDARCQRLRGGQVQQPEGEGPGAVVAGPHGEHIVARGQVQQRQAVLRIALVESAVADQQAARAAQAPQQGRVVGERVDIQPRGLAQREAEVHALTHVLDAILHQRREHVAEQRAAAVAAGVGQHAAGQRVGRQVGDQASGRAAQSCCQARGDVVVAACHVPQPDVVQRTAEVGMAVVLLGVDADAQRRDGGDVVLAARAADGALLAVDQHAHVAGGAVHHHREVVPFAGRDQAPGRLDALLSAGVADAEPDAAVVPQPGAVGALAAVGRIALVEDRRPGVGVRIDLDPGLDGQAARDVQRRLVRQLEALQAVELQRLADLARHQPGRFAVAATHRDRHRAVDDALHAQPVAGRAAARIAAAFDQQRVAAAVGQRLRSHVVIRHVVRAPDRAAEGIDQAPERVAAAGGGDVEEQALAGHRVEAVGLGLVGWLQGALHHAVQRQGHGIGQVQQPEAVGPGGVALPVDRQRVVAGRQVEQEQAVLRIAGLQRPTRHHGATGAAERPGQPAVVGERVEVDAPRLVEREAVEVLLAQGDVAGHHRRRALPEVRGAAVVAAAGGIGQGVAAAVHLQVGHQPGFVALQRRVAVARRRDLPGAQCAAPQPEVVDRTGQRRADLGAAAQQKRVGGGKARAVRAKRAAGRLHAVEVDLLDIVGAVDDGADVVPVTGDDRAAGGVDPLVVTVAAGQVQVAATVQPQAVAALVAVVVALVDQRLPRRVEAVGLEPELDRRRAGLRGVGAVRHLHLAHRVQPQRAVDPAGAGQSIQLAVGLAGHDVDDVVVGDLQQLEAVVQRAGVLLRPDAAFDQQRVVAVARQREQVDVVQAAGADQLAAELVEQAPGVPIGPAAAEQLAVDVVALVLGAGEAVDIGLVDRVQRSQDRLVHLHRSGLGHVDQPEREGACLVADRVDDQRVVAGDQVQQRAGAAELIGLRVVQLAAVDLDPARAAQRPAKIRVVVDRRQGVEQQLAGLGQAEAVGDALPGDADAAAGGGAELQRGLEVVDAVQRKVVVEARHVVGHRPHPALDGQRVGAGGGGHQAFEVIVDVEAVRAGHLPPGRVEHAPADPVAVVRRQAAHVEEQPVAGGGFEGIQPRAVRRVQRAVDAGVQREGLGFGQVKQAEGEGSCGAALAEDAQGVGAGGQVKHRAGAAELEGFAVVPAAAADQRAVGPDQAPAQFGREAAGLQHVQHQAARLVQREQVFHRLAGMLDAAVDPLADLHRLLAIDHRLHVEAVVEARHAAVHRPDAAFDQQRVAAGQRHGQRGIGVVGLEAGRPEQRAAQRVVKPPAGPIAVVRRQRTHVEVQLLAGRGLEPENVGLVGRVQRSVHGRARRQLDRRSAEIEQTEGIVARARVRSRDAQPVAAGQRQVDCRIDAQFEGLRVVEPARVELGAARPFEAELERRHVARGQRVEDDARRAVQREQVVVGLASGADRAVDPGADGDGAALQHRHTVVALEHQLESHIDGSGLPGLALDQQGVRPVQQQRQRAAVGVHQVRAVDQLAGRINQPPGRIAAARRQQVEEHPVAGRGIDAEGAGLVAGVQHQRLLGAVGQRVGGGQVQQLEGKAAGGRAVGVEAERVVARFQLQRRGAAQLPGIRVAEAPLGHQRHAARAQEAPGHVGAVVQRIEDQRRRRIEREGEAARLARVFDRGIDGRVQRQHLAAVLHRLQVEAPAGRRLVADAAFQRQHVAAVARHGEDVAVPAEPLRAPDHPAGGVEQAHRKVVAGQLQRVEEKALAGQRIEAEELGLGGWPARQRAIVVGGRTVVEQRTGGLVETPVARQAGRIGGHGLVEAGVDLGGAARPRPDAHLVDLAGEALTAALAAADLQAVLPAGDIVDRTGGRSFVHQHPVGIDPAELAVVDKGDVRPAVERGDVVGLDPSPARRGVGDDPGDAAVGQAGQLVLALLVDDAPAVGGVAARAGGPDPGLDRQAQVGLQADGVGHPQLGAAVVHPHRAVGLARRQRHRGAAVDPRHAHRYAHLAELAADLAAGREARARRQVEQAQPVGPGGVAVAIDGQPVVAGPQEQRRVVGNLPGIALREAAAGQHRAVGPRQRPCQPAVVGERIHQQPARVVQREGVGLADAGGVDAAGDHLAHRHGLRGRVVDQGHVEAISGRAAGRGAAFDQQRVAAVQPERQLAQVIAHPGGSADVAAEGIDQPPVDVVAVVEPVDVDALAGHRAELEGVGLGCRRQFAADRHAEGDLLRLVQIDQPEAVAACGVAHAVDSEHVLAGRQLIGHVAAAVGRIGLRQRPAADHIAERAVQRPANVAVAGQRIEDDPQVAGQDEAVAIGLAGGIQAALDGRDGRVSGQQHPRLEGLEAELVGRGDRRAQRHQGTLEQALKQPGGGRNARAPAPRRALRVVSGPRIHPAFPHSLTG